METVWYRPKKGHRVYLTGGNTEYDPTLEFRRTESITFFKKEDT